jgi:hypothetical protein
MFDLHPTSYKILKIGIVVAFILLVLGAVNGTTGG